MILFLYFKNDTVAKTSELKLARPKDKRVPKEQREARRVETNGKLCNVKMIMLTYRSNILFREKVGKSSGRSS